MRRPILHRLLAATAATTLLAAGLQGAVLTTASAATCPAPGGASIPNARPA